MGFRRAAVIDPGPAVREHIAALVEVLRPAAERVTILVTHGHPDHAPGAQPLKATLEAAGVPAEVHGPAQIDGVTHPLHDGDSVDTDEGELVAVSTPGHARHHLAFHWPARRALFAGDLVLGKGDTVWVGEYAESVADYLRSLERLRTLDLAAIYPAHGPFLPNPEDVINRFMAHRRERIRQVEAALTERPGATVEDLLGMVYGAALPTSARRAALMSMGALKAHVEGTRDGA